MLLAENYETELKYGGKLKGSNESQGAFYNVISVNSNGTTAVNLFNTSTAPTAGTITSACIQAADTTKGTLDLISDQGTLVRIIKSGTANAYIGSYITPIAFAAGSLLQIISAGSDNGAYEVTYYTFA